jgi:hypothetical protein
VPVADFLARLGPPGGEVTPTGGLLNLNGITSGDVAMQINRPQQAPQQQAPRQEQPGRRKGVKHFLGVLGDALLTGAGGEPIYGPAREEAELGAQLSAYLGTQSPELAAILQSNPQAGMALYNALREDKRFDRTAGQDDRRIGISEDQLGLAGQELGERIRSNKAGEGITERGQDVQIQLQRLRQQDAAADREQRAAMQRGDHAHAKEMEGLRHGYALEIAALGGGDSGYTETVVETPGTEATDGWFSDTPATPTTKTTTRPPARLRKPTSSSPHKSTGLPWQRLSAASG